MKILMVLTDAMEMPMVLTDEEGARAIPGWLAPVVRDFEFDARRLVTVEDVLRARPDLSRPLARQALAALTRRGWLCPTGVRGTYEFLPAAAGPYPSGDPWLALRAALARRPDLGHVGATSAAWLRGYAQRSPARHIVVTTPDVRVPPALAGTYRVLRTAPAPASDCIDGLPVPTAPELLAEVAQLAPRLSLDAAQGWLSRLLDDASPAAIAAALAGRGPATRARAGYIAEACGAETHAAAIAALGDVGSGPYYTGPRPGRGGRAQGAARAGDPFAPRWRVYDTGRVAA